MGIAGAAIATQLASGAGIHHKNQRRVFPLLGMVALTLLYGTRQAGIDNACHIGGLIAGGALGWLSARLVGQKPIRYGRRDYCCGHSSSDRGYLACAAAD